MLQVILTGVKNEMEILSSKAEGMANEVEYRKQNAAQLTRELDIMKDRLSTKDAQLKEAKLRSSMDVDSSIYMAGAPRKGRGISSAEPFATDRDRQLAKLHQERAELLAQMERLRNQNLKLNRGLANASKQGNMLQDKIKSLLARESDAHDRNSKLVDSLKQAGAPIPYGVTLGPELHEQHEYDKKLFEKAPPLQFQPEGLEEELLLSPGPGDMGPAAWDQSTTRSLLNTTDDTDDSAATQAIADEMAKLQHDANTTLAQLRDSGTTLESTQQQLAQAMAELSARDRELEASNGEKAMALAMLLARMDVLRRLADELEVRPQSTPAIIRSLHADTFTAFLCLLSDA